MRGIRMIGLRRPSWFAVLLTLAGVAFFVRLGIWQLDRAAEKEVLLRRFATAASAPVRGFDRVQGTVDPDRYPHVRLHGQFLQHRVYLLDDQIHAGRGGFQVYAPFKAKGHERLLLVDLGFLPRAGVEQQVPDLPPLPAGPVDIQGIYVPPPPPGLKLGGNALARQATWPKTTIYLDLDQIGADLHASLYPRVLLMDPDPSSAYVRQWTPTFMPPARHRGYAFQWFSFALAAIAIFVIMHRKRGAGEDDE